MLVSVGVLVNSGRGRGVDVDVGVRSGIVPGVFVGFGIGFIVESCDIKGIWIT
jgi:hypothetical protein